MRWHVPILGEAQTPKEPFSTALYGRELVRVLENGKRFEEMRKIAELRKSCGVESELHTINVRKPPSYGNPV